MDSSDANIYLNRILDEVATSRVINDALLVRETVKMGMREANVDGVSSLQKEYRQLLDDIDEEIDGLMREARIKKELMSATITEALMKSKAESIVERFSSNPKPTDKRNLDDKGVIRK